MSVQLKLQQLLKPIVNKYASSSFFEKQISNLFSNN